MNDHRRQRATPTEDGLIGLDWGTSSLRAYHLGVHGEVLETRERAWGLRNLPDGGFDAALATITDAWPPLPVLACGMVGSRRGWREVAYVETPAGIGELARNLGHVTAADGRTVFIVPGVHQARGPDVMRGEETQVIGALAQHLDLAPHSTWVLPGTHSKWVSLRAGAIADFATVMTGELFALLRDHSILGSGNEPPVDDEAAFTRGVQAARDSGPAGALSRLFSARTLMLDGELAPASVPDYLSGLLIGEELRSMQADERFDCHGSIQLVGASALCVRYRAAASHVGLTFAEPITDAAAHGLWQIARNAKMDDAVEADAC